MLCGLDPGTVPRRDQWTIADVAGLVRAHFGDAEPGTAPDEDGWCALGQGIVPWPALLADLQKRVSLFVLEHDKPTDHAAMLKTSFDFLHQHLIAN